MVFPYTRDKYDQIRIEEEDDNNSYQGRMSRDERLLMMKKIPLTVSEIIHSPMEQFNDLLSSKTVREEQIHICRDIRRRGKNKVGCRHLHYSQDFYLFLQLQIAAQNCRKRKISQIHCLESELSFARSRKENILSERVELLRQQQEWVRRLGRLERDILIKMGKEENNWVIKVDRNMVVSLEQRDGRGVIETTNTGRK